MIRKESDCGEKRVIVGIENREVTNDKVASRLSATKPHNGLDLYVKVFDDIQDILSKLIFRLTLWTKE